MATHEPRCFLFNDAFRDLGPTLQTSLALLFNKDKHAFYCHDYGCARYLALHPEKVDQFDELVKRNDERRGAHFVADLIAIVHSRITCAVVHVAESREQAIQKIRIIAHCPRFQPKEVTLQTIKNNFQCEQQDIESLSNCLHNAVPYSGSLITLGQTQDGQTALLINVFSIE